MSVEGIVAELVPLVADHARLHRDVVMEKGRGPKPVAEARQLAMALVFVRLSKMTAKDTSVRALVQLVGEAFERDESTVRHAIDAVNQRCREDAGLEAFFSAHAAPPRKPRKKRAKLNGVAA
ncbi:hypothetical protein [Hyphobacterium sp.]|uniref:hypothetical protein n=1 Tax=Hyphobacterium sp. TaxID=2004662 RepID=UPI003BAC5CE4